MAGIAQQNPKLKIQHSTGSFNPETGYEAHVTYSGNRTDVLGKFNAFTAAGLICSWDHDGPTYKLTVQLIDAYVADRWERAVEWAQVDIRQTPGLYGAASVQELRRWDADVDHMLDSSRGLSDAEAADQDLTIAGWPQGKQQLYRAKARGMTSFEVKRYVLRLRRMIRATDIANATVGDAKETVYSTAKLVSIFGVPAVIAAKLPPEPYGAPQDLVWGWRSRTDDVDTSLVYNKAQFMQEWVYEAVPTTHFTLIS